jgi:hypothetical protein
MLLLESHTTAIALSKDPNSFNNMWLNIRHIRKYSTQNFQIIMKLVF